MENLLKTFTIEQIILFTVLLAAAIKGIVTWTDWANQKLNNRLSQKQNEDDFKKDMNALKTTVTTINEKIDNMTSLIDLLMISDKDEIKAYITREHHYFCYDLGYIDDYNLDCIERRYALYVKEGGNSFVEELMKDIRALPKKHSKLASGEEARREK